MGGVFEDGRGRIVVDDRFFPLLVTMWIGPPGEGILRPAFAEIDRILARAQAEQTPVVFEDVNLRPSDLSMNNMVVRGTIRAMNWLTQEQNGVEPFATFREAAGAALKRMDREGLARPEGFDPDTYRPDLFVVEAS